MIDVYTLSSYLVERYLVPRTSLFEHLEYVQVLDSSPGVETIKMKIKMKFKMDA